MPLQNGKPLDVNDGSEVPVNCMEVWRGVISKIDLNDDPVESRYFRHELNGV